MRPRLLGALTVAVVIGMLGGVLLGVYVVAPLVGTATPAGPHNAGATMSAQTAGASAPASASAAPSPLAAGVSSAAPGATPPATFAPAVPGDVPILYYHRVQAPPPGFATWSLAARQSFMSDNVLPAVFAAQLDWLAARGYTTILPRDLVASWDRGAKLPARPIILTFDDGWADWATTTVPLLRRHHMVAEFYVVVDQVGPRNVTWADLRAFAAAGMAIGAHDVHHVQLTGFGSSGTPATPGTMWAEVSGARQIIGSKIGVPPDSMAYVGGGFDATLVALVQRAGYTSARSILRGVRQRSVWRYELRVSRIGGYDDVRSVVTGSFDPALPTFARRVSGADPG